MIMMIFYCLFFTLNKSLYSIYRGGIGEIEIPKGVALIPGF